MALPLPSKTNVITIGNDSIKIQTGVNGINGTGGYAYESDSTINYKTKTKKKKKKVKNKKKKKKSTLFDIIDLDE